ncbi:hypothetical protein ABID70_002420 [Clavibacter michiganensis]|nr:hypothetical protein [Clavibacter michiganensis]MDQ0409466.1 hypothetical protein [Clavibacter michiganensis]
MDYAACNVWKSASVYEQDSDPSTTACSAVDEYNHNSEGIKVTPTVPRYGNPNAPGQVYIGAGEASTYNC